MLALILCVVAFAACFAAGRRSLVGGLVAIAAVGYLYGIARANIPTPASHFLFDAGVAGLYLAMWMRPLTPIQRFRIRPLVPWVVFLIAWPTLLFFLPIQDPLVQLVGLRGQIMFLPFLLIGAMLDGEETYSLGLWFAGLNLIALGFAGAEWWLGVWRFFPRNEVTDIIYRSRDVLGKAGDVRIPAIFVNSAGYAATMVMTMPLLLGAWMQPHRTRWQRNLIVGAIVGSALGVFMAASRTHAAILIMLVGSVTLFGNFKQGSRGLWIVLVLAVGWIVAAEPSLQRFTTLTDTNYAESRLNSSVNSNLLELAQEYPVGNGLGGGGTSLPYFLKGRVTNPVVMENEYARIMLEQGIPGLCLWMGFMVWMLRRPVGSRSDPCYSGRWMARLTCVAYFSTAAIGTGLLTSIPGTPILLLLGGWLASRRPATVRQTVSPPYRAAASIPVRRYGW